MVATFVRLQAKCVITVIIATLLTKGAFGQSNVGEISGQITDGSGAAVPGCTVTATNALTAARCSAVTPDNGIYVFAGLPEGTWNVRVEKQGFRQSEQTGVTLDAASRRTIDFKMEVGGVAESVQVSAAVE